MLEFYRDKNCKSCAELQDTLEAMRLAHKTYLITEDNKDQLPEGTKCPVLVDEGKVIQGSDNIVRRLEELEDFKDLWEKFQSDACYCEE